MKSQNNESIFSIHPVFCTFILMNWKTTDLKQVNSISKNTLMETLDIKCVAIHDDSIEMTMPVSAKNHQPMGLLHGGATAALIESAGSFGSALLIDMEKEACVGVDINANHLSSVKEGTVRAIAKIVHKGRKIHVWQVDVFSEETQKMICTGRLTVMVIPR